MSKNLNEELTRIKTLFNFKMGDNSHDILSEEVITKSVISEQPNTVSGEVKREQLKPVPFTNVFQNNMVKVYKNAALDKALQELDAQIQSKNKEDKKLESISVKVDAGATPLSATNILPYGVQGPDHNYDNKMVGERSGNKVNWVKKTSEDQIPKDVVGGANIKDGNTYLANQRAANLKVYLEEYLTEKYDKAKVLVTIKDVNASSSKFASAVITGVVLNRPPEQPTNFYISAPGKRIGDKFYMGAAPASIWGKKKLNINNDFTLEKAQELAKKNITDKTGRDVRVTENPMLKNTKHPSSWYGKNQAWIEVKNYLDDKPNKQQKGVRNYWFKNYQYWENEKNNLQKYRENKAEGSMDQAKTRGGYSFTGTMAAMPDYVEKSTTEPLINEIPKDPYR